ncbi:MAG: FKBP-type peptidyl-prolyl cis-trans isomerase [Thermodesulfobacteriota bacterium]
MFLAASVICFGSVAASTAQAQNVMTSPGGVKIEVVREGQGVVPRPGQTVQVHYTGMLTNGTKFDSSRDRNQPFSFPLGMGRVVRGWDEAFAMMKVGTQARITIPPQLGYGAQGTPGGPIPPNATLIFDVELLGAR